MTIGWVREDALDRFFEGTEPSAPALKQPLLKCPFCESSVQRNKELYEHLYRYHSARRPSLLLNGREPASLDEIRRPIPPSAIQIDAEIVELEINGARPIRSDQIALSNLFTEPGVRRVVVRLTNARREGGALNTMSYEFGVFLPTSAELEAVDQTFVALFGKPSPHISLISELVACAEGKASATYAEALAEYVRGVLGKDRDPQSGIQGATVDWSDAYNRSVNVLKEVQRPLPKLISAIVRFALNDFSSWKEPTEFVSLDHSVRILGGLASGAEPRAEQPPDRPDHIRGVCPIDAGVSRVIELSARYSNLDRWSAIDQDEVTRLANLEQLGSFDRAKVRALWAWAALRLGSEKDAAEPLRAIEGHDCFGEWARRNLERVDL